MERAYNGNKKGAFQRERPLTFVYDDPLGPLLETFLSVSCDYLFLLVSVEVYEVIAVPCDPDEKPAVAVGMLLSVAQSIFVDYVELDMVPSELEVGADQVLDSFNALLTGED